MSESDSTRDVDHWPGQFHPASHTDGVSDDRLAPQRDLDERGVPEINAYNPSECWYIVFHEIDDANDPLGNAFIQADEDAVIDTEDYR